MTTRLYPGYKDAIHVPFVMVTCDVDLEPGEKCSLRDVSECVKWIGSGDDFSQRDYMWHGVADPYLEESIPARTLFQLHIRKECFKGLRHNFELEFYDDGGSDTCHNTCDLND